MAGCRLSVRLRVRLVVLVEGASHAAAAALGDNGRQLDRKRNRVSFSHPNCLAACSFIGQTFNSTRLASTQQTRSSLLSVGVSLAHGHFRSALATPGRVPLYVYSRALHVYLARQFGAKTNGHLVLLHQMTHTRVVEKFASKFSCTNKRVHRL